MNKSDFDNLFQKWNQ